MVERLFLDWIDAKTRRATISSEHHFPVQILTDKTSTALLIMQLTVARTEIALNTRRLAIRLVQGVPPAGGMR